MRRAVALVAVLLAPLALGAGELWVSLVSPRADEYAIGRVELAAEVVASSPITEVTFFADGAPVAVLVAPPYRVLVDLGEANVAHNLRVVATDADGDSAGDTVSTSPIPVNAELDLELQQLYVTVTEGAQRVTGLGRDRFTVVDDGVAQRLVTFEGGEIPFTAVLLIDSSTSMRGAKIAAATAGASAFIDRLGPLDRCKVVAFADQARASTPFSGMRSILLTSLSGLAPGGGTALLDHLYLALRLLEARQGRRVVVFLSDGVDTLSVLTIDEVLAAARTTPALVYWVRLGARTGAHGRERISSAWHGPEEYERQAELLESLVADSGGRTTTVTDPSEIEPTFVAIARELREQYALGYYPSTRRDDGRWHPVEVRVAGHGLEARTHSGYVDLAPRRQR